VQIHWQACWELLSLEYFVLRKDFRGIHERVRTAPLRNPCPRASVTEDRICHAIDVTAALYFKNVQCLQRSAAAACLLKKYGFRAEMVIGVQQLPFLAHAWVEIAGRVVNDKPYMAEIYSVLARC
jgi:Transglutaminase-like superfamily